MKTRRHAAILNLVRHHQVKSQQQLRELLQAEGVEVTQGTLSRDIHELRLIKITDRDGNKHYALPSDGDVLHPSLDQLLPTLLISIDGVGNLVVIRTPAGSANAIASALDHQAWKEVVGNIAGDDTNLIVTRSERARRAVTRRLERLAGLTA